MSCLVQLGELEDQNLSPDPAEGLLPADSALSYAPSSSQGQNRGFILPNNFNFSNNNLLLDGASLLSPLESPEKFFTNKAHQVRLLCLYCNRCLQ